MINTRIDLNRPNDLTHATGVAMMLELHLTEVFLMQKDISVDKLHMVIGVLHGFKSDLPFMRFLRLVQKCQILNLKAKYPCIPCDLCTQKQVFFFSSFPCF